jgi:glycosyltransferase involved in cell wall biosynthesis
MVCGSYAAADTGLTGPFTRGRRSGPVDGIDVIELALPYSNHDPFLKRAALFMRFAARSVWIALTHRYDIVFATSTPLTVGIPGIVARWLRGRRFVFEVRDLWPELPRALGVITNPVVLGLLKGLEWMSYRSAHRCIGLSPGIVEGIQRLGVPEDWITLIPNGCDLTLFAPTHDAHSRSAPFGPGDLLAVFSGAHGIANGLDAALDAAAELKRRGRRDIWLVFIGDGKEKPRLVQRKGHEQLDNCMFLDLMPKPELVKFMQMADVGMMILADVPAFYYGTSPNKFFDYIAAGMPVLTNYPGWLADMIKRTNCGRAVPPGDSKAFADALEALAGNRAALAAMGRSSRALAEQEFDRNVLAGRFVAVLENLASC